MKASSRRIYGCLMLVLLVMSSFVVIATYVLSRANLMEQAAVDISENAAPSIKHLSAARAEVRHLMVLVERYLDRADLGNFAATTELRATCMSIRQLSQRYEALPMSPGEQVLWERATRSLLQFDKIAERLIVLLEDKKLQAAETMAHGELFDASVQAGDAIMTTIEWNAWEANHQARRIRQLRAQLSRSTLFLSSLGVLWTVLTVLVIGYYVRSWAQLRAAQHLQAIERAEALERFAGQVAHDILNPLATVNYVLSGVELAPEEALRKSMLKRGGAAAMRVKQILDGLLKFACAGAKPEPGARADVKAILADLSTELGTQAAQSNIELRMENAPAETYWAACSPGILNSLLTNLVHNAIKYMGDAPSRRITLRVLERGNRLRFEVEDTGPGLLPGLEKDVFEPYVRGTQSKQPGFGLGLATVKKAAEAHGGAVGVQSKVGAGCLFWFELARADSSPADGGTAPAV